jgi:predicted alpha/beta superfamily hydrolase
MKKILLIISVALCFFNCETKKSSESKVSTDKNIVIGQKDVIYSNILEEDREIWVHLPESTMDERFTSVKYPVLYLLDGASHFHSVTGMIKQLSPTVSPEMIVIGITNTDRTRDLTPTHVNEMDGDTIFPKTSGGGKKFLRFIEEELMPYVEETYQASSYKTFVGHSFGGLAVIDALIERPELFNNYIAIDPSLWWDNQELLNRANNALKPKKYKGKSLYVGVANTMDEGKNFKEVEKDTTQDTEHIRSILKFAKTTEVITDNGLNFKWKYYDNDSHGSVPLITEYDAIRFLFSWYELKGLNHFFNPTSNATTSDLLNLLDTHYKTVSTNFGYTVLPPESLINRLGYDFIDNPKTQDRSHALFNLNIQNYPNSSNVYDSMGDYYLTQQDTIKALKFFTKALEVVKNEYTENNEYTQEKLDMLKKSFKNEQ